jgi:hypothetical protein
MEQRVVDLKLAFDNQIKLYEVNYNIISHREYLKKVFDVKLKIDVLENQVKKSAVDINMELNKTSRLEGFL